MTEKLANNFIAQFLPVKRVPNESKQSKKRKTDDRDTPVVETDEFLSLDADFDQYHDVILRDLSGKVDAETVENAAENFTQAALLSGDRLKLANLLARFEDYYAEGRTPPKAMLGGILAVFTKFRASNKVSMDEAFGLKQLGKGRGKPRGGSVRREMARTQAMMVQYHIDQGVKPEIAACEKVEDHLCGFGLSASQIKRNYNQFKKIT